MPKHAKYQIDILIDKLTNSILNTISGDSFQTEITEVTKSDFKHVTKKKGWNFNWAAEFKMTDRKVFKLTIKENLNIIQGLVSVSDFGDHFYLHLVKSAPFNLGQKNYMKGFLAIFLLLLVNNRGIRDMKDLWHFNQKQFW